MDISRQIGQKILIAFHGKECLPPEAINSFTAYYPSGVTLFRSMNIANPVQLKSLTAALQRLARSLELPPLLIATDQEGGQLMAVGDCTPLPGNMALGATLSPELTRQAGEVLGRELAALGINVNYAPCADVNSNPRNPVVGTRSFGEDPILVGELAAAMIAGIQAQGVAATVKHFPGHGDTASDTHHGQANLPHSLVRLQAVELPPFRAALQAGAQMVMSAHLGVPAIDGSAAPPASLSRNITCELLRRQLGFDGVVVTDALDMHAIQQGEKLGAEALRAAQASADLLLVTANPQDHARVHSALLQGLRTGALPAGELHNSLDRIARLKEWLGRQPAAPDLSVIRCAKHLALAGEIAGRAITLVRDHAGLLPIRLPADKKIAVVVPTPQDLTPADTSSYITPELASAMRQYHPGVQDFRIPFAPGPGDQQALLQQLQTFDLIVLGTINAYAQEDQAELVRSVLQTSLPVIVVALRLPYDLAAFPQAPTYVCTYSILEPAMRAVAQALFGLREMTGRLPVSIPGIEDRV